MVDYNSLYPSIIRKYNICLTTVKRPKYDIDNYTIDITETIEKLAFDHENNLKEQK